MITQEYLKSILHYDPETGIFTWKMTIARRAKKGREAGYLSSRGYVRIRILGEEYTAHRLAWFYVTGDWPFDQIDHINRNPADNRFKNLREATNNQNQHNSSKNINSKCGIKGVCLPKGSKKYKVKICVNSKAIHLGYYSTLEEAAAAYRNASIDLHGEYGCTG